MKLPLIYSILLLWPFMLRAQPLRPGFDRDEYIRMMGVSAQFGDSGYAAATPAPAGYRRLYRSAVVGLENRWEYWADPQGRGIVSIRGTTAQPVSWMANLYAAMVPAQGTLHLAQGTDFTYDLAAHPKAAVHVGWLVALGFMAPDMLAHIDSSCRAGGREFLIVGHSQGGAIAYLLTAYVLRLQKAGRLPADARFKTYCSAGPKPGNLYFAYEYEAMTQNGGEGAWACNVVNAADWVPQTPFSVQTVDDFPDINPFSDAKSMIKKQKGPKRWALKHVYNQLTKPSRKAVRNYQKYLGGFVSKSAGKNLDGFSAPEYYNSNYYVRAGAHVVLWPDSAYYRRYPNTDRVKVFINHFHPPYLYLAGKLKPDADPIAPTAHSTAAEMDGAWEVVSIPGSAPGSGRKPFLTIQASEGRISGNTGCNSFSGRVRVQGSRLSVPDSGLAMTKMFCMDSPEQLFLTRLKAVTGYRLEEPALTLLADGKPVMELRRKEK